MGADRELKCATLVVAEPESGDLGSGDLETDLGDVARAALIAALIDAELGSNPGVLQQRIALVGRATHVYRATQGHLLPREIHAVNEAGRGSVSDGARKPNLRT